MEDVTASGRELKCIDVHFGPEVTGSNLLARVRVVPDRREGNVVYGRSLEVGEVDSGKGIPVFDDLSVRFPVGSIRMTVADVDAHSEPDSKGYAPVANAVWTWLALPPKEEEQTVINYLLATARRLDEAYAHCCRALRHLGAPASESAFRAREAASEALGAAESMCVALGRAVRMIGHAHDSVGVPTTVPEEIREIEGRVYAIRDAFEHIDERVFGKARREDAEGALSAFDQASLFADRTVRYAGHSLDLSREIVPALIAARGFVIGAASVGGRSKVIPVPIELDAPIDWIERETAPEGQPIAFRDKVIEASLGSERLKETD